MLVERAGGGREPRVDPGQRAPVGLVAPVLRLVRRARGQLLELRGHLHHAQRLRQLAADLVDLLEEVVQRGGGLADQRLPRHVVGDIGIAVAVAADPRTEPQHRSNRDPRCGILAGQQILDLAVQPRQLAQEGVAIVGQPVLDLVAHGQAQLAQDTGLPHGQDLAPQRLLVGGELLGRELLAVALGEQARDVQLAVEDALALHLGGVGGEHRRHQRIAEELRDRAGAVASLAGPRQRQREAAFLRRRSGQLTLAAPAVVVQVLGDVGELREIGEGTDHGHARCGAQHIQHAGQLTARLLVAVPPEADGKLADLFDLLEGAVTLLLAQRVAQQPAQQADVFPERMVFVQFRQAAVDVVHATPSSSSVRQGTGVKSVISDR